MRNHAYFLSLLLLGAAIYLAPIRELGNLSHHSELYSHFMVIPLVSLYFFFVQRKVIFAETSPKWVLGLAVNAAGMVIFALAVVNRNRLTAETLRGEMMPNDYLSLCMIGAVAWFIGSFIAAYGLQAFRQARLPLFFLVFAIPIPLFLLNPIIKALQYASAEAANMVFKLSGVPYHRNGLIFELPKVAVKVAEVCSGIRSSLALFILSIITGYMFLKKTSRRTILALSVFPITIVKNAFRIVTISLLANYVDMSFLTDHWIHSSGGIPFFAVALSLFIPMVWILRRTEKAKGSG